MVCGGDVKENLFKIQNLKEDMFGTGERKLERALGVWVSFVGGCAPTSTEQSRAGRRRQRPRYRAR